MVFALFLAVPPTSSSLTLRPGVAFLFTGDVVDGSHEWRIIFRRSFADVVQPLQALQTAIRRLFPTGAVVRPEFHSQLARLLYESQRLNETYADFQALVHSKRWPRALFPVLGSVSAFCLGLATEDDIAHLETQLQTNLHEVTSNTHLINSTLSILSGVASKQAFLEAQANQTRLTLATFSANLRVFHHALENNLQDLNSAIVLGQTIQVLLSEVVSLSSLLRDLIDGVTFASQGFLSPILLGPEALKAALRDVETHLPEGSFFFCNTSIAFSDCYKSVSIERLFLDDRQLLIAARLPLTTVSGLYHVYSAHELASPTSQPGIFQYLELADRKLAISHNGKFSFTFQDFPQYGCDAFSLGHAQLRVCNMMPPVMPVTSVSTCLQALYFNLTARATVLCSVAVTTRFRPTLLDMDDNKWFYDLPADESVQVTCDSQTSTMSTTPANRTGFLQLQPICIAQVAGFLLRGRLVKTVSASTHFLPYPDFPTLSLFDDVINHTFQLDLSLNFSTILNESSEFALPLRALQAAAAQSLARQQRITFDRTLHYTWGLGTIIFGILLFLALAICYCRLTDRCGCCTSTSNRLPPRSSSAHYETPAPPAQDRRSRRRNLTARDIQVLPLNPPPLPARPQISTTRSPVPPNVSISTLVRSSPPGFSPASTRHHRVSPPRRPRSMSDHLFLYS